MRILHLGLWRVGLVEHRYLVKVAKGIYTFTLIHHSLSTDHAVFAILFFPLFPFFAVFM